MLNQLWNTQLGGFHGRAAAKEWQEGRRVSLAGFAPWQVPLDPTWREDPYANASWRLYYHSLGWLLAADASGQATDHQQIATYLLDWIDENDPGSWDTCSPWDDLAVSLRTDNMVLLLSGALRDSLAGEQLASVIQEVGFHGQLLASYLDDALWRGHNHRMFHALSLYNLATAFPELAGAQQWKARALESIQSLPSEMVDPLEGVSLEQAPSYHYLAIDLFVRADDYLSKWGAGLDDDTSGLLARMLDFAAVITRPDGSVPAIGDTPYRGTAPLTYLQEALDIGINSEMARFLLTHGRTGMAPPEASFYPRSGYAVFRSSRTGSIDDLLHVVFDAGPSRRIHGHDDALNVVVAIGGREVIVDSGGPYAYGNPGRFDFVIGPAHNLLLIPGETYRPGDATFGRMLDDDAFSMAEGWHTKYSSYRVRRAVVVLKALGSVLVIDQAELLQSAGTTPIENSFELTYHLPPGSVVPTSEENLVRAAYAEGAISVVGSARLTTSVADGQTSPSLRGWVTPSYAEKVAAPALTISSAGTSAWFVTLIEPLAVGDQPTQSLLVSRETNGDFRITILQFDAAWHFLLPVTGEPTLAHGGD